MCGDICEMETMFTYTNRRGVIHYIHETPTKAGSLRYTMNRNAGGALAELPTGMEIVESINGQVYIRKVRPGVILPLEEKLVQQTLAAHDRDKYRVEVKGRDIIIHKPNQDVDRIAKLMDTTSAWGNFGQTFEKLMRKKIGDAAWQDYQRQRKEKARLEIEQLVTYMPVLRLRLDKGRRRLFSVERMSYRGHGGWLWLRSGMPLATACEHYVPLLGTYKLFEEC